MTPATHGARPYPNATPRRPRWRHALVALALLVTTAPATLSVAQPAEDAPRSSGARALMARLLAPCCWRQTVDLHDSDVAAEMRREIQARLNGGEPAAAIEADFVRRYGPRVLALPGDTDPSGVLPAVVGAALVAALLGLVAWVRLGRDGRDAGRPPPNGERPTGGVDYDTRLDEELARLRS